MSGVPSTPSTPGPRQRGGEPLEQVGAAGHGHRRRRGRRGRRGPGGRRRRAAAGRRRRRAAGGARGRPRLRRCARGSRARISVRSATAIGWSCAVHRASSAGATAGRRAVALDLGRGRHGGGALEACRRRCAPATLANSRTRRRSQPASRPWHEGAAEGVAGAEAVDDLDREGRHLDALVAGRGEHALGALLDDGELDAALEQGVGGTLRVGLADGDLALLAVADGDGDVLERLADLRARPRPGRPRTSAGSRGRGPCGGAGPAPPRRRKWAAPAGLLRQAGDGGPETPRRRGSRPAAGRRRRSCRSGAVG